MKDYDTSRTIFNVVEFSGYLIVLVGIVAGFFLASQAGPYVSGGTKFLLFLYGASGSAVGLAIVGAAHAWHAAIDTAETNDKLLKRADDQLKISKELLVFAKGAPEKAATPPPAAKPKITASAPEPVRQTTQPTLAEGEPFMYKGYEIHVRDGKFWYAGIKFASLDSAKAYLDRFG